MGKRPFDPDMVMEWLAKVPKEFTITPRNLDRKLRFGGGISPLAMCPLRRIIGIWSGAKNLAALKLLKT